MHFMYVILALFVLAKSFAQENNTTFEDVIFTKVRQIGNIGSRASASIGINGNSIFVLGGYSDNKTVEGAIWSFDTTTGLWTIV